MNESMKQLIAEARLRVDEIVRKLEECPDGHYVAIVDGEEGYPITWIQTDWYPARQYIPFGCEPLSRKKVLERVAYEERGIIPPAWAY